MVTGRDAAGRFAPGYSPDRGRGRPRGVDPASTAPAMRAAVIAIANAPVVMRSDKERRRTEPLFKALLWRVATGRTSRRTSVTDFIRLVFDCAGMSSPPASAEPFVDLAALLEDRRRLSEALISGSDDEVDEAVAASLSRLRQAAGNVRS